MTHSKSLQQGWMKTKEFCAKYGISVSTIHVAVHYNTHSDVIKKFDGTYYVNEKAIDRRNDFKFNVWNECHKNYYKITEHITQTQLARLLVKHIGDSGESAWRSYISQAMWMYSIVDSEAATLLNYRVPDKLWTFWRYTNILIRRLERKETLVEQGCLIRIKSGGLE